MPVVISFLNSASGLAACFAGFVVKNNVLIVGKVKTGNVDKVPPNLHTVEGVLETNHCKKKRGRI